MTRDEAIKKAKELYPIPEITTTEWYNHQIDMRAAFLACYDIQNNDPKIHFNSTRPSVTQEEIASFLMANEIFYFDSDLENGRTCIPTYKIREWMQNKLSK